jgi:hypothetical protein
MSSTRLEYHTRRVPGNKKRPEIRSIHVTPPHFMERVRNKSERASRGLEYHTRRVPLTNSFKLKMSAKGLEPLTNGLKGHCSTIELRAQTVPILS